MGVFYCPPYYELSGHKKFNAQFGFVLGKAMTDESPK